MVDVAGSGSVDTGCVDGGCVVSNVSIGGSALDESEQKYL